MLRMLFVEDQPDSLIGMKKQISQLANVECVNLWTPPDGDGRRYATGEELFGAALRLFSVDSKVFDLLCMDISFRPDEPYGGIRLYNRLVGEGMGSRWRNVAVLSNFVKQGVYFWDDYFKGEGYDLVSFAIAVWADTSHVPNGNLINRGLAGGNAEKYAAKLINIASTKHT